VIGEAADGLEAVRIAAALQPHAVILDLEMPRLDGYRAAAQIKSICPSCRVVALTVHGDEASRRMAAAAHIDAFIVKGAPIISLISALTSEMEESDGKHIPAEDGKED
jgi:DNA-binding NarL/FixJ family response regulator